MVKSILASLRIGDYLVVGILLSGIAWSTASSGAFRQGTVGIVEVDGRVVREISLETPGEFTVQGRDHPAVIRVRGGTFEIVDDRCPHPRLHSGKIFREGEFRVCIPNRLLIRIPAAASGAGPDTPDAITQ